MARVTYTPLARVASGSAANITFSTSKGVAYIKQRKRPYDPQTPAQLAHRASIALTGPIWRAMSNQLQDAFSNAPLAPEIPGYHTFVSLNRSHLQALDGLVAPTPIVTPQPPILLPTGMHFTNMWWGEGWGHAQWNDAGQGDAYRLGYFIWDATRDRLGLETLNASPLASEYKAIRLYATGQLYLFMGFVYRTTDQEIVHCHYDAAVID